MKATMIVIDSGNHGKRVAGAAADTGFKVDVQSVETKNERLKQGHNQDLWAKSSTVDKFEKSFEEDVVAIKMAELKTAASELKSLEKKGVHHSAINLSQGMSKASTVQDYYDLMRRGWEPEDDRGDYGITVKNERGRQMLHNFAEANGLDEKKLLSSNPEVSGPERTKLQQLLIAKVDKIVDGNADLKQAKSEYDSAVVSVEKNNNSMVVAAENAGQLFSTFKKDAGKVPLNRVNADFFANPLSNQHTTTVGALTADEKKVASYSNPRQGEIYANGSYGGHIGTSYAAPRVAAAMAKLHQLNPNLSSEDVEEMVKSMYSKQAGGQTALDADKVKAAK